MMMFTKAVLFSIMVATMSSALVLPKRETAAKLPKPLPCNPAGKKGEGYGIVLPQPDFEVHTGVDWAFQFCSSAYKETKLVGYEMYLINSTAFHSYRKLKSAFEPAGKPQWELTYDAVYDRILVNETVYNMMTGENEHRFYCSPISVIDDWDGLYPPMRNPHGNFRDPYAQTHAKKSDFPPECWGATPEPPTEEPEDPEEPSKHHKPKHHKTASPSDEPEEPISTRPWPMPLPMPPSECSPLMEGPDGTRIGIPCPSSWPSEPMFTTMKANQATPTPAPHHHASTADSFPDSEHAA